MGTIAIIQGGASAEREVSLSTAKSISTALTNLGLHFQTFDPLDANWISRLKTAQPKTAIIALHGPFGEDGTVQQLLEENNIPYTGSSPKASRLAIDKVKTKKLIQAMGIPVPREFSIESGLTYPVVVKPNKQGSSFGVSLVKSKPELATAIRLAKKYDQDGTVIVEERVFGRELTCGVIDLFGTSSALPVVEIIPNNDFFDFTAKYATESGCQEICPAQINDATIKLIQEYSLKIFKEMNIRQYGRIDWILRDGQPVFLEVNTLPGMTPTSLIIKELKAAGIDYNNFINQLIETVGKPQKR